LLCADRTPKISLELISAATRNDDIEEEEEEEGHPGKI
jgi:hypothetical protein